VALKKNHMLDGTMHMGMYIRLDNLIFEGKDDDLNRITRGIMFGYESKAAADAGEKGICYFDVKFIYDLSSPDNLWKQAYDAAKALPEMEGAVDDLS
jgi:hypothetical protein